MSRSLFDTRAFRLLLLWLPYVLAVVVYAPSLGNGFIWDDHALIEKNAFVHDLSHVWTLITHDFWHVAEASALDTEFVGRYYRPFVSVAFAVQATLFGVNPLGFHVVSLLFHLACCALVYRALVLRLPGEANAKTIVASIGATLFAIHPTRPEVVGWISGSTDLFMTFWSLVALNLWASHRHRASGLVGVVVASLLALFSKETAIVLPFALAADAWLLGEDRAEVRKDLLRASAVIVPVVAALGLRMWLMPFPSLGVANQSIANMTKRVLASVGEYIIAILWHIPGTLRIAEARFGPDGPIYSTTSLVVGAVAIIAVVALSILAIVLRRLRPWLADVAWSVAFLAPVANIVPLGMKTLVAARFLYAPLFGVVALLCRALSQLSNSSRRAVLASASVATLALACVFGVSSMRQLESFFNDETLWEYEYEVDRQNGYVLGHLLDIHGRRGNEERVIELLRDLQELSKTGYWPPIQQIEFFRQTVQGLASISRTTDKDDLNALARAYDTFVEQGVASFSIRGIAISIRTPPTFVETMKKRSTTLHLEQAILHVRAGNLDRATQVLRQTVEAIPHYGRAWLFLGRVHALQGQWDAAIEAATRAEASGVPPAEIARLRADIANARAQWEAPGEPIVQRALAYRALGAAELIRATAEEGLRHHPGEPNLVAMLVELELRERRPDAAMAWVRKARNEEPNLAELWDHLEARIAQAKEALAAL